MTIHLSIVIFLPLAGAVVGAFLPAARSHWGILAGSVGAALYAIVMAFDFDRGADGLQYVTDDAWISELGIRWSLGVDGLNLWLILLTALLWVGTASGRSSSGSTSRLPRRPCWVRSAPRTWRSSSSSST
jgi:NADH-quinone oxidoreductase subunit M